MMWELVSSGGLGHRWGRPQIAGIGAREKKKKNYTLFMYTIFVLKEEAWKNIFLLREAVVLKRLRTTELTRHAIKFDACNAGLTRKVIRNGVLYKYFGQNLELFLVCFHSKYVKYVKNQQFYPRRMSDENEPETIRGGAAEICG